MKFAAITGIFAAIKRAWHAYIALVREGAKEPETQEEWDDRQW
jgi:hypothetical protein